MAQTFDKPQIVKASIAGIAVLGSILWLAVYFRPPPPPANPGENVQRFIQAAKAILSEPQYADLVVVPSGDHTGVIVKGDIRAPATLAGLQEALQALEPKVPVEFIVAVDNRRKP